jgi:hypothetical protein
MMYATNYSVNNCNADQKKSGFALFFYMNLLYSLKKNEGFIAFRIRSPSWAGAGRKDDFLPRGSNAWQGLAARH